MDVRGVEITNQLRSAIRAKLIELGVRYDEELPDYILVMVVNKKSRLQMNEDLRLFLEEHTEPFVNWLHDQVLKKLQKVTIAKKKIMKEVTPITNIIKKEEEGKKLKVESQSHSRSNTPPELLTKCDRDREFEELVDDLALLNEEDNKTSFKKSDNNEEKSEKKKGAVHYTNSENIDISEKRDIDGLVSITSKPPNNEKTDVSSSTVLHNEVLSEKANNSSSQSLKRRSNTIDDSLHEKNSQSAKRSKVFHDSDNESDNKIKSCINKPKLTSVVSVKSRLGVISPSKKLEVQNRTNNDSGNLSNKNVIEHKRNSFSQNKSIDRKKRRHEDLRNELRKDDEFHASSSKNDKTNKIEDLKGKGRLGNKSSTIKSRLGINNTHKKEKLHLKSSSSTKVSKPRVSNVKSRLGLKCKQNRVLTDIETRLTQIAENNINFQCEEDDDNDAESVINTSLRSHIIAVKKSKIEKKKQKISLLSHKRNQVNKDENSDTENEDNIEEDEDQCKLSSKVIVTPRPLKPLKPFQKRATQSLLLRAVAEANQSVVMQKKMDPCLKEQKPVNNIQITRDPREGKILSVSLNSKKKLVMEKIQIELKNPGRRNSSKLSQIVTDEHLDVVKSLFKRSDDKQKFLVTLNGYNNNILKEKHSDDEERLEMEVNEDDELALTNNHYESYIENDQMIDEQSLYNEKTERIHDLNEHLRDLNSLIQEEEEEEAKFGKEIEVDVEEERGGGGENKDYINRKIQESENDNEENLNLQENPTKKRRKLSPIVYTRSRSNSPQGQPTLTSTITSVLRIDKRPLVGSVIATVTDKSSEKCRYWPNCTLGVKCAYYHPEVLCSSFPACKFGEKCAYKHPKCKFGSACSKLGCMFSHPPIQCKYHPYCMKPGCPFSHPKTLSSTSLTAPLTPDISTVRAKFTWKKKE